jgi:hypothetical protein
LAWFYASEESLMMRFEDTLNGARAELMENSSKPYDKLDDENLSEESITGYDEKGIARIVMEAEKCANVRMVIDHEWQSPAMRWAMVAQAYTEMRNRLRKKGYGSAYCFFPEGVPDGYIKRLIAMGADRITDRCIRFTAEAK